MSNKLKITLTSGLVGKKQTQRKVVEALGLGRFGSSVVHSDTPIIRGMLNKVHHLVTVTQADAEAEMAAGGKKATAKKPAEKKTTAKTAKAS